MISIMFHPILVARFRFIPHHIRLTKRKLIPDVLNHQSCDIHSSKLSSYLTSKSTLCRRWSHNTVSSHSASIDSQTLIGWTHRLIERINNYWMKVEQNEYSNSSLVPERKILMGNIQQVLFHWATLQKHTVPVGKRKCDFVEDILQAMMKPSSMHSSMNYKKALLRPNAPILLNVIETAVESYEHDCQIQDLDRAEKWYYYLIRTVAKKDYAQSHPIHVDTCFTRIIHALCKTHKQSNKLGLEVGSKSNFIERAWRLVRETQEWQVPGSASLHPFTEKLDHGDTMIQHMKKHGFSSKRVTHALIHLFSTIGDDESLKKAEMLLDHSIMEGDGDVNSKTDSFSYNMIIQGHCQAGRLNAAEKLMLEWFGACQNNKKEQSTMPSPDITSINILLNALADTGDSGKIERFLHLIETLNQEGTVLKPDRISYSALIKSYAFIGQPEKAEAVLERMVQASKDNEDASPDHVSCNAVIESWALVLLQKRRERELSSRPWQEALARCREIVRIMESQSLEKGRNYLQPSTATFNALLKIISSSRSQTDYHASKEAIHIFDHMNERYETKPNMSTFSILFPILGRDKMYETSQDIFIRAFRGEWGPMNIIALNAFLTSIVDMQSSSTSDYALSILHQINQESSLVPSTWTYNIVLNIIAKCGKDPSQAEDLLTEMESHYNKRNSKHPTAIPNTISYSSCINAIARSDASDKIYRTRKILQRMQKSYQQGNKEAIVNTILLNNVLNACCFVQNKLEFQDALMLVNEVMEVMRGSRQTSLFSHDYHRCKADSISYATVIKVYGRLMEDSPRREEVITNMFQDCCSNGLVNTTVLNALKGCTTEMKYNALVKVKAVG